MKLLIIILFSLTLGAREILLESAQKHRRTSDYLLIGRDIESDSQVFIRMSACPLFPSFTDDSSNIFLHVYNDKAMRASSKVNKYKYEALDREACADLKETLVNADSDNNVLIIVDDEHNEFRLQE